MARRIEKLQKNFPHRIVSFTLQCSSKYGNKGDSKKILRNVQQKTFERSPYSPLSFANNIRLISV